MKTLAEGSTAPDFELPDQDGEQVRLSKRLVDGPVVLFFYPGAMTGGCTREGCRFRDLGTEFAAAGAQRLGISADPVAKQQEFATTYGFDYPLLADVSGEVAAAYGVRRRFMTPVKRVTFVIDTAQVVRRVVSSEMRFEAHADEALAAVRQL